MSNEQQIPEHATAVYTLDQTPDDMRRTSSGDYRLSLDVEASSEAVVDHPDYGRLARIEDGRWPLRRNIYRSHRTDRVEVPIGQVRASSTSGSSGDGESAIEAAVEAGDRDTVKALLMEQYADADGIGEGTVDRMVEARMS